MHPSYSAVRGPPKPQMAVNNLGQSNALKMLNSGNNMNANRNMNGNNAINNGNNSGKIDAATFIKPESIPKMLSDMKLPHRIDHATAKFYQEVSVLYVRKVFDLAMDYAQQRRSTNVEMKDVLRAIKKYSVIPPNQWNQVKAKSKSNSSKNKSRNAAMAKTHKRRLNIARINQKAMDKTYNKNKK
mmetsp:Transcript_21752/g.19179  ORF Transcript_21752/g.19179 Transcript_21752/m.19179 type:complete len:185 (-) Transcript_21752:124-678(-)